MPGKHENYRKCYRFEQRRLKSTTVIGPGSTACGIARQFLRKRPSIAITLALLAPSGDVMTISTGRGNLTLFLAFRTGEISPVLPHDDESSFGGCREARQNPTLPPAPAGVAAGLRPPLRLGFCRDWRQPGCAPNTHRPWGGLFRLGPKLCVGSPALQSRQLTAFVPGSRVGRSANFASAGAKLSPIACRSIATRNTMRALASFDCMCESTYVL
jgi:hypothetical protein